MKPFFKLALSIIALSFAQQASAAVIRVTGSTAFRAGAHKGIVAMMGGETNCKFAHGMITGAATAQTQAAYEGADYTVIQGTISGIAGTSTVYCSWTGSATGVADVSNGTQINFIPASALPSGLGYANAAITQVATQQAIATLAFSDAFVASTPTPNADLTDHVQAVIPFCWVANRLTTGITNMTQQQARAVLSGSQPKSLWTGNAADTSLVLAVGRDTGSGTRIICLAETKYGISNPTAHYKLTSTGTSGSGSITVAQLWPLNDGSPVVPGSEIAVGNGGYSSGSTIRGFMGMASTATQRKNGTGANVGSPTGYSFVSWLGISDANTATNGTNNAVRLSYEGVTYDGSNPNLIYNGSYTAWGYLHLYSLPSTSADEDTFISNMDAQLDITSVLGTAGLQDSLMVVGRQFDGAVVGP